MNSHSSIALNRATEYLRLSDPSISILYRHCLRYLLFKYSPDLNFDCITEYDEVMDHQLIESRHSLMTYINFNGYRGHGLIYTKIKFNNNSVFHSFDYRFFETLREFQVYDLFKSKHPDFENDLSFVQFQIQKLAGIIEVKR